MRMENRGVSLSRVLASAGVLWVAVFVAASCGILWSAGRVVRLIPLVECVAAFVVLWGSASLVVVYRAKRSKP